MWCGRRARSRSEVWITVTSPAEASRRRPVADTLVVQGVEAGGHRGIFADVHSASDLTLLAALQLIRAAAPLPLVATGGLTTGAAIAAALVAGADAAQLGTAYQRCPEAVPPAPSERPTATTAEPSLPSPSAAGPREASRTAAIVTPLRGAPGLPRGPPPDRAVARPWSSRRRCRPHQPLGRPDPSARPSHNLPRRSP